MTEARSLNEIEGAISPEDELDLGGEGFATDRVDWLITKAGVGDVSDDGERQSAEVTFEGGEDDNGNPFEVTVFYTLKHPNEKATNVGRGQLKRLMIAATGSAQGTIASLEGKYVSGVGNEDGRGFRQVSRFRPVKA